MTSDWDSIDTTSDANAPELKEESAATEASALGEATPTVDGASLAAAVWRYIREYVVLSSEQLTAVTLFVLHTWCFEAAQATPYLVVLSPLWQTGKTRLLEVLERLVASPIRADDITGPALFRAIEALRPTVLLDELDVLFASMGERADTLRSLLNAGNRVSGVVHRCVPPSWDVKAFSVFCPKVLAGIDNGRWPDTLCCSIVR